MKSKHLFSSYLLIILFITVISSAFVQDMLKIAPFCPNTENRKLSDKPVVDIKFLDPFPTKFETYYNDHFAFRNHFVKLYADISLNIFKKDCPFPDKILIGKNNELFGGLTEMNTYLRNNLFKNGELEKIRSDCSYRKKYLEAKGIDYYVVICPTKYSIYAELLPWYFKPSDTISRTDQFVRLLKELNIQVVDLRRPLLRSKDSLQQQIFKRTDNHWNDLGSFIAYQTIMERISEKHPEIKPLKFSDFNITAEESDGGNLATILNKVKEMKDIKYNFEPKFSLNVYPVTENPYPVPPDFPTDEFFHGFYLENSNLPKILIIHDSFTNSLEQFFKYSFSKSVFIWDKWQYKLNEPIVEAENPDIYVAIILESLLGDMSDNCTYK